MRLLLQTSQSSTRREGGAEHASVLIIVLWVALGLVAMALYFAHSMSFEMRASDNRMSSISAEQAIEGAARYVSGVLAAFGTNGMMPDITSYQSQAVPIGDAHFWLIGRSEDDQLLPDEVYFGLIDEGSKLNLNTVSVDMLNLLTNMYPELAANIVDWRSTNSTPSANGDGPTIYSTVEPAYTAKASDYETIDELKLIYPMELGTLFGEDLNLNGTLDPGETDTNRNNMVDCGLLEYVTVYSSEPNTRSDGSQLVNIASLNQAQATALLQTNVASGRLQQILLQLGFVPQPAGGGGRGGGNAGGAGAGGGAAGGGNAGGGGAAGAGNVTVSFQSPLAFYRRSGLTAEEFAAVETNLTASSGSVIRGRININTAPAAVLACLPGLSGDLAQQVINYRRQNQGNLSSIAWIVEALGSNNSAALDALQAIDYITVHSYQFSADIAALGPYGRGYRRVRYVFDTSSGTPRILYRQDLSHLGWALGKYVRQDWVLAQNSR